jgi:hypothetical protein
MCFLRLGCLKQMHNCEQHIAPPSPQQGRISALAVPWSAIFSSDVCKADQWDTGINVF